MRFADIITDSDDPPRTVVAMLEAVEGFMNDCLGDQEVDASEGLTPDELRAIQGHIHDALDVFIAMYTRIGREL
jgi:hypothetical protein